MSKTSKSRVHEALGYMTVLNNLSPARRREFILATMAGTGGKMTLMNLTAARKVVEGWRDPQVAPLLAWLDLVQQGGCDHG